MGVRVLLRDGEPVAEALKRLRRRMIYEHQWPATSPRWYKPKPGYYMKPSHLRRRRWLASWADKHGVPHDMQGRIPKWMCKGKPWPKHWRF